MSEAIQNDPMEFRPWESESVGGWEGRDVGESERLSVGGWEGPPGPDLSLWERASARDRPRHLACDLFNPSSIDAIASATGSVNTPPLPELAAPRQSS